VNYERKKKGAFLRNIVHIIASVITLARCFICIMRLRSLQCDFCFIWIRSVFIYKLLWLLYSINCDFCGVFYEGILEARLCQADFYQAEASWPFSWC